MTNKEKYKQTFDTLSASVNFSLEVDQMSILNSSRSCRMPDRNSRNRNSLRIRSWRNST